MQYENIKINEMELDTSRGQPISVTGRRYRQPMAGINLKFSVWGADKKIEVEDLFANNQVIVQDPFADRTYKARGRITASSYQKNASLYQYHHYEVKLRELETVPEVKALELQGHSFSVIQYQEHNLRKRPGFSINALLRLTQKEFSQLRDYQALASIKVRRIGTDKEPVEMLWGRPSQWSKHDTDSASGEYIKQYVQFFPLDMAPAASTMAALTMRDEILERVTLALSIRFQALLTQLIASKTITQAQASKIMMAQSAQLLDPDSFNAILLEQDRVADAGAFLL